MRIEGNMKAVIKTMKIRVLQEHESKEQSTAEELECRGKRRVGKKPAITVMWQTKNRQLNGMEAKGGEGTH